MADINDLIKQLGLQQQSKEINEEILKQAKEKLVSLQKESDILEDIKDLEKAIFTDKQNAFKLLDNQYDREIEQLRIKQSELALGLKVIKETYSVSSEEYKLAKQKYEQEVKTNVLLQKRKEIERESANYGKQLADKMGLTLKENAIGKVIADIGANGVKNSNFFKGFKANISGTSVALAGLNLVAKGVSFALEGVFSYLKKSFDLALEYDDAFTKFTRTTGTFGTGTKQALYDVAYELREFGITAQDVTESYGSLIEANTKFLDSADTSFLANQVARYKFLGVSVQTTSKQLSMLQNVYGKTEEEAALFQQSVFNYGRQLKLSNQQTGVAIDSFEELGSALGDRTGKEFSKMLKVFKSTNLEMAKLVQLAGKFDTFESAADTVGRLNSLLGGPYLNAIQMIENVNPADRIMAVQKALVQAGKSFETMEYYERKSIASALGMETRDLALLMAGRQDLIEGFNFEETTGDIINSAEQMRKLMSISEKLKTIFISLLMPLEPLVDALHEFSESDAFQASLKQFRDTMSELAKSDEFKNSIKELGDALMKLAQNLPSLITMATNFLKTVVENPKTALAAYGVSQMMPTITGIIGTAIASGTVYKLLKGVDLGNMISKISSGRTSLQQIGAQRLARLSGGTPTPSVPTSGVPTPGAPGGPSMLARGGAITAGALVGSIAGLGISSMIKGTSFGTEFSRARTGALRIGSWFGLVDKEELQQRANATQIKAIRERQANGRTLSAEEKAILGGQATAKVERKSDQQMAKLEQNVQINLVIDGEQFANAVLKIPAGSINPNAPLVSTIVRTVTKGATPV
jgi:hypothetical protein